jgi:hypothetical protein
MRGKRISDCGIYYSTKTSTIMCKDGLPRFRMLYHSQKQIGELVIRMDDQAKGSRKSKHCREWVWERVTY